METLKKFRTFKKFSMEPKYIYFDELGLNIRRRFSQNFRENESVEQIYFSSKKQYFITNLC